MNSAREKFSELVQRLKASPTLDTSINLKRLCESWSTFRTLDPEHGDEVTPALLVAIILHDEELFGSLISETELTQLIALGHQALDNYQLKTNPVNQPGKLLAASLKESI